MSMYLSLCDDDAMKSPVRKGDLWTFEDFSYLITAVCRGNDRVTLFNVFSGREETYPMSWINRRMTLISRHSRNEREDTP